MESHSSQITASTKDHAISSMTADDVEEVANLFAEIFRREPMTNHLQDFEWVKCRSLVDHCLGYSLVYRDPSQPKGKNIIAFSLCHPFETDDKLGNVLPHAMAETLTLVTDPWVVSTGLSPSELNSTYFYWFALGTKDGYEGKGIGYALARASVSYAKKRGYKKMVVHASAHPTHVICQKLGFQKRTEIKYDSIMVDGKRPFKGLVEPETCSLWDKDLSDWEIEKD